MRLKLFTAIIVSQLLCLFCIASPNNGKFILVIDAGHGGHDAGAIGTYSKEKNINLNVALAFGKLVENNCSDVRVIYTRKTDVFIALQERAEIANRNKKQISLFPFTQMHYRMERLPMLPKHIPLVWLGLLRILM